MLKNLFDPRVIYNQSNKEPLFLGPFVLHLYFNHLTDDAFNNPTLSGFGLQE